VVTDDNVLALTVQGQGTTAACYQGGYHWVVSIKTEGKNLVRVIVVDERYTMKIICIEYNSIFCSIRDLTLVCGHLFDSFNAVLTALH